METVGIKMPDGVIRIYELSSKDYAELKKACVIGGETGRKCRIKEMMNIAKKYQPLTTIEKIL